MADVEVTYRGQTIRSMSASGTEVLHTGGKLCDDDITIEYTSPGGGSANLQTKSVSYTPSESAISDTILPDPGYDGMDKVDVSVAAIPDSYVGSGIPRRSSADLSVMGRTVTAPSGYYSLMAAAQVAAGTAGTPAASKGAVSNHSVDVTPSVTNMTGYITGSTINGTPVTVSASELVSGSQTITANGTYDVTDLAEAVVNVSGGGSGPWTELASFTIDQDVNAFQFEYTSAMAAYDVVIFAFNFTLTAADWIYYSAAGSAENWDYSMIEHKLAGAILQTPSAGSGAGLYTRKVVFPVSVAAGTSASRVVAAGDMIKLRCYTASKYITAGSTLTVWGANYADL